MTYEPLNSVNFQNGLDVSSPPLSPASQVSLGEGTWNAITSGSGLVKPFGGATSQGAGTGSRKMCVFGNTWGGIKDYQYANGSVTLPTGISSNTATLGAARSYVTGVLATVSSSGSLPTGLAGATTYYLIVVDSTHVKFASSLANALTGTALTISGGTGVMTITVATAAIVASGSWLQDIGLSRWGIGSGQPHIEGISVPGFTLSTNLQVQIATGGVYGPPVQAGLAQPSAPEIGIVNVTGTISNSMSAKISRSRPSTGAVSVSSPTSAVVTPIAQRIRLTFPAAAVGQTHWRAFFPFQGFGGVGIHYLGQYNGMTDIPESVVAAGSAAGSYASGNLTFVSNPADAETIVINGVTFTFKTSPGAGEVQIGATDADTSLNLAAVLNASTNPAINVATYSSSFTLFTITYDTQTVAGNAYTLADSSAGAVTRSGATLTGGVDGIGRSLEFNFQDGDLLPIEANYDNYAPPAATHAIRLNTVMNLAGCYADASSNPTSSNTGTAIAVSKENDYESYVPTSLLYLPEQVVDVLARPLDDYGYIGCQNSIHAIQFVGNRGDELPSCTITTILPDIGVEYMHNWCHFRGQLLIYTAQGNLMLITESGEFDTTFANPVTKILRSFTTANTSVGYDPLNDSIVVMCGKRMLAYSIQYQQWRQIWLPDFDIPGTCLPSCTVANRKLYFSMTNESVNTAFTYDTAGATASLSFASNFQNSGGVAVDDLYEMAVAANTSIETPVCVAINRNLSKGVFRQIRAITGAAPPPPTLILDDALETLVDSAGKAVVLTSNTLAALIDDEGSFYRGMVGKKFILFGPNVGGPGIYYLQGTILQYFNPSHVQMSVPAQADVTDALLFVGEFVGVKDISAASHIPNWFPNVSELRSYTVAVWMRAQGDVGNVLTVDLMGSRYSSSRAR